MAGTNGSSLFFQVYSLASPWITVFSVKCLTSRICSVYIIILIKLKLLYLLLLLSFASFVKVHFEIIIRQQNFVRNDVDESHVINDFLPW